MVMRTMREQTKWVMLLTAIAFVALMVFEWGMDLSGQSSAQVTGGELGRVNGEPITYEEYLEVYRGLYDRQQAQQDEPIGTAQNRDLEDAAWNQLVMDRLVRQELRRRGIRVTETEIRQAARYAPPPEFMGNEMFQTDGQFDLAKYHQFLASPAVNDQLLMQLEAYYRDVIPRNKLYQQVVAGLYLPESELWRMYRDRSETVRVAYIALDPDALIQDSAVSVSDEEVEAYYRANQAEFERPASAQVRLAVVRKAPTGADSAAALERAREVRQEVLDGADFAEVASRESSDEVSAASGGELGTFQRGQMVPAFDQAVFGQSVGEVGEPVLTQFGYHVIEVQSREGDEATARHILIPIETGPDTEEAFLSMADSLETLGATQPVDSAAARLGLPTRSARINPELAFVPGVGRIDEGADWVFEGETAPVGTSPVFEAEEAFYALEVVERTPEGVLPLSEAAAAIRARLLARAKLEQARGVGEELVARIRSGASLQEAAAEAGLEAREAGPFTRTDFVPGLGQANAAIGTAFGLPEGRTSGLVEAEGDLFILRVLERTEASRESFEAEKELVRARAGQAMQQEILNRYLAELRERAEIVDNRSLVLGPATVAGP